MVVQRLVWRCSHNKELERDGEESNETHARCSHAHDRAVGPISCPSSFLDNDIQGTEDVGKCIASLIVSWVQPVLGVVLVR